MPRKAIELTALAVKAAMTRPGRYYDGKGLILAIRPNCTPIWLLRYTAVDGRRREIKIADATMVGLSQARVMAAAQRKLLAEGTDPIDARYKARDDAKRDRATALTFGECCSRYIDAHRAGWKNKKHANQWRATLATYCAEFYDTPVAQVAVPHVLSAIEPIWTTKAETASRVRQRIEVVLDWARARGYRAPSANPARLRGHIDALLPKSSKVRRVVHRAALDYRRMPEFMAALREREGLAPRALELQILTATRPGEAAAAAWTEFDLAEGVWAIPRERMKAGIEHRVPLSASVCRMLAELPQIGPLVFPSLRGKPITTDAAMKVVDALAPGVTAHGFRSAFHDWASESGYAREVVEAALAHRLKDKVEAAYARSDLFERRARLMDDWAAYCDAR